MGQALNIGIGFLRVLKITLKNYSYQGFLDKIMPGSARAYLFLSKSQDLAWCAEFLHEIHLKILLRKTGARLNYKIALIPQYIDPGLLVCRVLA